MQKSLQKPVLKSEVTRAVLGRVAQHPSAVYPISLGLLGGFAALILGPTAITLGVLGAGVVLGAGGFAANYFMKKDDLASRYMREMRIEMVKRRQQMMQHLEADLMDVNELSGLRQIKLLEEKYENLLDVLDKKLEPGELTHARYLTIAEQVFLAGLDNLQAVALALKSVSTIDISRIEQEIDLSEARGTAAAETLKERRQLYDQQHSRANLLLTKNESALTQLDLVTTKLANVVLSQGHAAMDIEDAMKELQNLILRVDQYSIKK